MNTKSPIAAGLLSLLIGIHLVNAQSFTPGRVYENQTSITDPAQSYELFLPSKYDGSKSWPILFAMDPRARGHIPMTGFRNAADSLGYIVMSSNNTFSDEDGGVNIAAVNAMINDALQLFNIDTTRFYFAGFSGTARASWTFGFQLPSYTAGIIGVGAANNNIITIGPSVQMHGRPFSFYGLVGFYDYNFMELTRFGQSLRELEFPHHLSFFEGYHQWPKGNQLNEALFWMELRAMQEGRIETDLRFVTQLYKDWLNPTRPVFKRNDPYELKLYYQSIIRNFGELIATPEALLALAEINKKGEALKTEKLLASLVDEYYESVRAMLSVFEDFKKDQKAPDHLKLARQLKLEDKKKALEKPQNPYRSYYLHSQLELIYVHATFYQTREYIQNRDFKKAYAMLKLSDLIYPDDPRTCYQFARVYSQLDMAEQAFQSLECLYQNNGLTLRTLDEDPMLAPLRSTPEFTVLRNKVMGNKRLIQ